MPSEGVSMCVWERVCVSVHGGGCEHVMGEDMSMCVLERVCVSVQGGGCEHCVWERMCGRECV